MKGTANGYVMYGAGFSLYSGKLRSYLRKKGIAYVEKSPSILTYKRFIVPRTGVRFIPVLHTPQDEVLQDTTAIIDVLESRFPQRPVYPATPRQHLAALLLELYGDEWLLIPAMHYRWNFPDDNLPFVHDEFGAMLFPWFPKFLRRWLGKRVGAHFHALVPRLGITDALRPAVEQSWLGLLAELEQHFAGHDFLFGTRPSIGDFGLIGPMYAHLYRDPHPGKLMRERAPKVAAWVERMVSADPCDGSFLPDDEVPETLMPVLRRMVREQVPVLVDTECKLAQWLAGHPAAGEIPRVLGQHAFELEQQRGSRMVLPHSLWRWQRPRDFINALDGTARQHADALAAELGLADTLHAPARVRVTRRDNRFVIAT